MAVRPTKLPVKAQAPKFSASGPSRAAGAAFLKGNLGAASEYKKDVLKIANPKTSVFAHTINGSFISGISGPVGGGMTSAKLPKLGKFK